MKHEKDGLTWYTFDILKDYPELRHGYFTKKGGASGPKGDLLNLAFAEGHDRADTVMANIDKAANALDLPAPAFVRQSHSASVSLVWPADGYQPRAPQETRRNFDAMIAPKPGVSLLIKTADCQAVLLYDPALRMLGLAHSGWRGSVQNIIGATVKKMTDMGAEPRRMLGAVGPSLGPCCAEFIHYRDEFPQELWPFQASGNNFDFWAISRRQLTDCGFRENNIEVAGVCTKCSPEFFSYRRGDLWGRFGLLAGVIE